MGRPSRYEADKIAVASDAAYHNAEALKACENKAIIVYVQMHR